MAKFGRFLWNNNDFINVFIFFIGGVTSLRSLALWRVHRNTGGTQQNIFIFFISWHFMLDIVSSGDNLQEKSKLYLLEKYEKNVLLCSPYFCVRVTELSYEGK